MGLKLNLFFGEGQILSSHLNLSPLVENETDNLKRCDLRQLDMVVDNGEAEEIICTNILTHFPIEVVPYIIDNWLGKLAVGGKLIISDTDIEIVCDKYNSGNLNDADLNSILYGKADAPLTLKRSIFNSQILINFLKSKGLHIIQQSIDGLTTTIIAQRVG